MLMNGAKGSERTICTVYRSTALIPSRYFVTPLWNSDAPLTLSRNQLRGEPTTGSSRRDNEYTTSSAVTSRPLWKRTPCRRLNVQLRPSLEADQDWASAGSTLR